MTVFSRRHCAAMLLGAAGALAALPASAQFPDKPVRLVVPYTAGGGIDVVARVLATRLSELWGKPVVVENKPGAGAVIGSDFVAKAPADGHTLLMTANTIAISAGGGARLPFNLASDFTPVTLTARAPLVLVVNPAVPAQSVKALIDLSRSKPGGVSMASAGQGGLLHLAIELLKSRSTLQVHHVPYKGTAGALTDVMGGRVDGLFATPSGVMQHVRKGSLRALAVTGSVRSAQAPDVPTMVESGIANYDVSTWFGLLAPAGTPRAVVDRIHADVEQVLRRADVLELLSAQGLEAVTLKPDDFGRLIRAEVATWGALIKEAGIKLE